ncbi:MAG: GNAT family N-acetyltransferase, partial [Clostridia bacterium]|nr:GNAT family N-acetyltransferase [Clostridia bacterium]
MVKVAPLTDRDTEAFISLFTKYYSELDCADNAEHLVKEYVLPDCLAGLISIDVAEQDGKPAGFVIYQIDGIENEWNFKEGFGDVREIFVDPLCRRKGLGKLLLYTAELKLKERGAQKSYCLPYEEAIPFFTACGYKKTEVYNDELDCFV